MLQILTGNLKAETVKIRGKKSMNCEKDEYEEQTLTAIREKSEE